MTQTHIVLSAMRPSGTDPQVSMLEQATAHLRSGLADLNAGEVEHYAIDRQATVRFALAADGVTAVTFTFGGAARGNTEPVSAVLRHGEAYAAVPDTAVVGWYRKLRTAGQPRALPAAPPEQAITTGQAEAERRLGEALAELEAGTVEHYGMQFRPSVQFMLAGNGPTVLVIFTFAGRVRPDARPESALLRYIDSAGSAYVGVPQSAVVSWYHQLCAYGC